MNVNDDNFTNADDQVWERHEIPEEYHYKLSKNSPPILVLAQPKTIILSSSRDVQRPVPPGESERILFCYKNITNLLFQVNVKRSSAERIIMDGDSLTTEGCQDCLNRLGWACQAMILIMMI